MRQVNISIIVTILSSIFLGTISLADDAAEHKASDSIVKVYDLSSFSRSIDLRGQRELTVKLLPFFVNSERSSGDHYDSKERLDVSCLVEFLPHLIGEEIFYRDPPVASLDYLDVKKMLIVTAPPAIQSKIGEVLEYFKYYLCRKVNIDIEVYTTDDDNCLALNTPQEIRDAADKGKVKCCHANSYSIDTGDLLEIDLGTEIPLILDHDPEIAQSATCVEPVISPVSLGINLALRPLISIDDSRCQLRIYAMASRFTEPLGTRECQVRRLLSREKTINESTVSKIIDDPNVAFASTVSSSTLQFSEPQLMQVAFPHHAGLSYLNIVITVRRTPSPAEIETEEGKVFKIYDLSTLIIYEDIIPYFTRERWPFSGWESYSYRHSNNCLSFGFGQRYRINDKNARSASISLKNIAYRLYGKTPENDDHHMICFDKLFIYETVDFHEIFTSVISKAMENRNDSVEAEIKFIQSSSSTIMKDPVKIMEHGRTVGKTLLKMSKNSNACSVAGFEGIYVGNYDVDVATNTAISNPNTFSYLDGAMVFLLHKTQPDEGNAAGEIQTNIQINRLIPPIKTRQIMNVGNVDQPTFEHGFINNTFATDNKPHMLGYVEMSEEEGSKILYVIGQAKTN